MDNQTELDVVVVGGGISGLRTGVLLKQHNKKVVVLEANDRVGGRTKGQIIKNQNIQYDIGGQWIGPTQDRMYRILEEYSLQTMPQTENGYSYQYLRNTVSKSRSKDFDIPGSIPIIQLPLLGVAVLYIDHLAKQVPVDCPWNAKRAEEWDSYSIETWMRSSWWAPTKSVKSTVEIICWCVLATEPSRVSFLWFLWFVNQAGGLMKLILTKDGAQQDRIIGGAVQVSQKMAEELENCVMTSSPVTKIQQFENKCKVILENGKHFICKKVVIACSPAMSRRITFSPVLPGCSDALMQGHLMGHVIKVIIFYDSPFWIEKGYSGLGVSDKNIRLSFDASYPEKSVYALVGFFLGDAALQWCDKTKEDRKQATIEHFSRIFGDEANNPVDYIENNWPLESYIRGAYMSIPPPNILTRVGPAIRTPIGNIHFAGTETATQWSGYMEGGLQAAERVTKEIMDSLSEENFFNYTGFNSTRKGRVSMVDYSAGNLFSWRRFFITTLLAGFTGYLFCRYKNISFDGFNFNLDFLKK